jgi:hypothetical protein
MAEWHKLRTVVFSKIEEDGVSVDVLRGLAPACRRADEQLCKGCDSTDREPLQVTLAMAILEARHIHI